MSRKIYFSGSINAGRIYVDLYGRMVDQLKQYGEVLTPFVADKSITHLGSEHDGGDKGIHDRDVELLEESDVIVAEVTQPSLGVGYEIARAYVMKKKILCLYRPQPDKKLSAMIRGMADDELRFVTDYNDENELEEIFANFFREEK